MNATCHSNVANPIQFLFAICDEANSIPSNEISLPFAERFIALHFSPNANTINAWTVSLRKCTAEPNMKGFSKIGKLGNAGNCFRFHFSISSWWTSRFLHICEQWLPNDENRWFEWITFHLNDREPTRNFMFHWLFLRHELLRFATCALCFIWIRAKQKMNRVAVFEWNALVFSLSSSPEVTYTHIAKAGDPTKVLYFVMRYHFNVHADSCAADHAVLWWFVYVKNSNQFFRINRRGRASHSKISHTASVRLFPV